MALVNGPKLVAGSCYEMLLAEVIRFYDERHDFETMEKLGFTVGFRFLERFSKDKGRLGSILEILKFLCRDFWYAMFNKHVDKLQTNHKGVFVLHDMRFKWISHLSIASDEGSLLEESKKYLVYPCGIIRGALANLGISCTVRAEVVKFPACSFHVHISTENMK